MKLNLIKKFFLKLSKHLKIFIFLGVSFLSLFQFKSFASKDHVYVIGIERNDLYPYFKQNEKGETIGYIRAVLDLFAKMENVDLKFDALPISRLFHEFLNEKSYLDFKFPDDIDWQKDLKKNSGKAIYYSEPVSTYKAGFFLRKERVSSKNLVIGIIRGYTVPSVSGYNKSFTFEESNSLEILLKKLAAKRIDGIYYDYNIIKFNLNNQNINDFSFGNSLPIMTGDYRLSSIKHRALIYKFNNFMKKNKIDIHNLKKKYYIEE